ncbi:hypothetical protein CIPAW_08G017700 [Carya illinoinensis]|uniref:Uncharacterized protein n=1 Tax=Carya illinoinensis TaxID=32201 RepID=A0A8T1PHM3_CARIL|nr:hypothetical protein CIPAW_08G017700 [Carya illinoinensis]
MDGAQFREKTVRSPPLNQTDFTIFLLYQYFLSLLKEWTLPLKTC